tara:strand:- start:449 stop:613 length:165 start_codon:yes stop_codon:yes gene_type:complete
MIKVGDLVKYKRQDKRLGVVIKIIDKFERDDNILVQWNEGRAWCVSEGWIELVR